MPGYIKISGGRIAVILAMVLLVAGSVSAQDGRWVQYSLSGFGAGAPVYDRGDGLVAYTQTNADKLLVFDIQTGEWQEISLGGAQNFEDVETEGNIAFAYTDKLLIGYSAVTMTWDTMTYTGDYSAGSSYYYEAGENLAYFLTKSYLYVFVGETGNWQSYDYGLGAGQFISEPWVMDDYVGMVIVNEYPAQPTNVVYSMHAHDFNKTDIGAYKGSPPMDHGFAGLFNVDYDNENYILTGYSALTNSFSYVYYTCGDNESSIGGSGAGSMPADEFTAKAYTFRHIVPNETATANWYGFDTRRGSWDHTTYAFDWDIDHYYGCWYQCGQFAFDHSLYEDDNTFHIFIYDGSSGTFRDFPTGLVYKSTTSSFGGGGRVFCSFDTLNAWGYNTVADIGSTVGLALDKTVNFYRGEDFVSLTRWSTTADTMIIYFYNGQTNNWSSTAVPEDWSTDGSYTGHIFMFTDYPDYETVFYSSYRDEIFEYDFTDGISVAREIRDPLACAKSDETLVLFDGLSGQHYVYDMEIHRHDLGTNSLIFYDTTGKTLYGYNTLSENWTSLTIGETPYACVDTGYIGLISEKVGFVTYNKFYAYNGLADSWVELVPNGSHYGFVVGNRTALVVRDTDIYAFDPERAPVDVADEDDYILPAGFSLKQNYPNPFNPNTIIEYSLPHRTQIEVAVYNLLGRRVRTIVDKTQEAGDYKVVWSGRDDFGKRVASGLYFYQVKAGEYVESRKMLLLK